MHQVHIIDLPGVMLSSKAISIDVLATANRISMTLHGAERFAVSVAGPAALNRPTDLMILPGLGCTDGCELKAAMTTSYARQAMMLLQDGAAKGATVSASCASSFLLAEAGLLD